MPNITSTMTAPVQYNCYITTPGGQKEIKESVTIAGGANVANKHFVTPVGVVTQVTTAQVELLQNNATFKVHLAEGFVKIHAQKKSVSKDLKKKDKSAPITPKDFTEKGKKAPKTTKE